MKRKEKKVYPHRDKSAHIPDPIIPFNYYFKLFSIFFLVLGCLIYIFSGYDRPSHSTPSPSHHQQNSQPEALVAIKTAIKNSWLAYANSPAWGSDEFHVIGLSGTNLSHSASIGFFVVDVIDTLLLTGEMEEEYQRCRRYIRDELTFDVDGKFNAFEVTIRVLGGLLSAYYLSGNDQIYLDKAIDLGNRLLPIFNSPTGIPYSMINLKTGQVTADSDNYNMSSLAEATTLQLEFKYLAHLTQNQTFWDVAENTMLPFKNAPSDNGLLPILVSPEDASFFFDIRLGSRGDSYYEYLIKQYLQTNRTQVVYKEMFDEAMTGVKENLVQQTPNGLLFIGELQMGRSSYRYVPKQDHLVCFLGGTLLLGVTEGQRVLNDDDVLSLSVEDQQNWLLGKELIKTCVTTYQETKTGLGPEIVHFIADPKKVDRTDHREWFIPQNGRENPPFAARNILRPETVESIFLAWRVTHDPIYREWGWQIFQAFEKHCRVEATGAFASIDDVDRVPTKLQDRMETFWLAETMKYLLLLFGEDSVLPLSSHVFNTEAHIFPVFSPTFGTPKLPNMKR